VTVSSNVYAGTGQNGANCNLIPARIFLRSTADSSGPILATSSGVIWFYERRGDHLRCEIRQQIEVDRFALVVTLPDGTERTEWFDDSNGLTRRSVELEKMLREKGWNGPFARDIWSWIRFQPARTRSLLGLCISTERPFLPGQ
jgi:hypothetical protein